MLCLRFRPEGRWPTVTLDASSQQANSFDADVPDLDPIGLGELAVRGYQKSPLGFGEGEREAVRERQRARVPALFQRGQPHELLPFHDVQLAASDPEVPRVGRLLPELLAHLVVELREV